MTPTLTHFFYKYRLWKRSSRIDEENTSGQFKIDDNFKKIHNPSETKTPRTGGIVVWLSVIMTIFITIIMSLFPKLTNFEFISRSETLLPLISLVLGALLGLADDFLQIFGNKKNLTIGIPRKIRIFLVLTLGLLQGLWFYLKLGRNSLEIPFTDHTLLLGWGFIFFFMFVVLALFSSSVIDGIDGLAGGVLSIIFSAYGFIGVLQGQYFLSTFCFVVMGAILAFLWFNIPPARFYLGETGVLSLTLSLSVIIFLTDTVFEFVIIGLPLIITSASSLGQIISRRFFNKKILKIAPFHHHLEALGWSRAKITMRYWIFTIMCSSLGIIFVIIG
jgi:phospho-N-acetylmuramoyl-pentapeptide-transferase